MHILQEPYTVPELVEYSSCPAGDRAPPVDPGDGGIARDGVDLLVGQLAQLLNEEILNDFRVSRCFFLSYHFQIRN